MSKNEDLTNVVLYGIGTGVGIYAGYFAISSGYKWLRSRWSAEKLAIEEKTRDLSHVKTMISKVKKIYFGYGSINKIHNVLNNFRSRNITRIIIVCSNSAFNVSGAWHVVRRVLKNKFTEIQYKRIVQFGYGHTTEIIDKVVRVGRRFRAQAVIGIGGGSPLDAAKLVAVLLHPRNKNKLSMYVCQHISNQLPALPIVCINTSIGSGSEINKYSLIQEQPLTSEFRAPKRCYSNWRIYPTFTLNDPELTFSLSRDQTIIAAIHALSNAIESATSIGSTRYSQSLAKKAVRYIVQYLPKVIEDPEDREGRYFLMYAGMVSGMALDEGMSHLGHGLVRVLTSFKKELPYGQACSILLPSVVKNTYVNDRHILHEILEPLILYNKKTSLAGRKNKVKVEIESLGIRTGGKLGKELEKYFVRFGMDEKLYDVGVKVEDVPVLLEMARESSVMLFLMQSSVCVGKEVTEIRKIAEKIFMESFRGIE